MSRPNSAWTVGWHGNRLRQSTKLCQVLCYTKHSKPIRPQDLMPEGMLYRAGASSTIACTSWSIVSVMRLGGRLELFERIENTTASPLSVVA